MVIRLSIVFGSLLFFFCRDEDNGRADLWLSSAFFSFSVRWSVLVMKNRGWCWPLLSNVGLDFCYVCGLRFLCFFSVFLGFFFLVLFFLSRFSLSFSSVSPSNPPAFLPLCAGFSFYVPPMIWGSIPPFCSFLPLVFGSFFFQYPHLRRSTPLSFYKARTGGNGRLQWVSVVANGWNASAFTGRAVAEEEDGEQSLKTTPFSSSKDCFQFGPWILIILQSSSW